MNWLGWLVLVLLAVGFVNSHSILMVVVLGSHSHKNVFVPLANHLAKQGHKVTFLNLFKTDHEYHENVEEIVTDFYVKNEKNFMTQINPFETRNQSVLEMLQISHGYIVSACREMWKDEVFLKFANDTERHYDVAVVDGVVNECSFPLLHKFRAPYIFLFPTGLFGYLQWLHNVPVPVSYLPFTNSVQLPEMNFKERFLNCLFRLVMLLGQKLHFYLLENLIREISPYEMPSLIGMMENASLVFSNEHIAMDYPKPTVPNIINIGGIGTNRATGTLPKDLKEFIEGSGDAGVILFSFGSIIRMQQMPPEIKTAFKNTFGRLKQRVIWKYESPDDFTDVPPNVKLVKWVPQQEVLSHPKTKFFISHGGVASVTECLSFGVPIFLIPFFGDQFANTAKGIYRGYALYLEYNNLTESSISWAVNEILTNSKYKANAVKTSELLMDNIAPPLETAEYWIDYVVRHKGAPHLKNEIASSLNLFQYFLIDVIAFVSLVVILSLGLIFVVFKFVLRGFVCLKQKIRQQTGQKNKKVN